MATKSPDFTLPPQQFFALPGVSPDIQFLEPNPCSWQAMPPANILAFSCSVHAAVNDAVTRHIRFHHNHRSFSQAIKINSHPVVLSDARYDKSFVSLGHKWLLNGASGTRLRNKFFAEQVGGNHEIDQQVDRFFAQARAKAPETLPTIEDGINPSDLDFAIECRNTFNFYHFLVETLGQLCVAADLGGKGKIFIHSPTKVPAGFVRHFVNDLFPEFRGRVRYVHKPKHYKHVASSYNFLHGYPQFSDAVMPSFEHLAPPNKVYHARSALRTSLDVLAMNSFDGALEALRERGLRLSKARDRADTPERIFIGRKPGGKRDRQLKGQTALLSKIKSMGFTEVFLENLPPLEQIATINNAKIIMGAHGAGLANMIFADPGATVIELGNAHTALYRWGDFTRLAHVAGCTYTNFFADMLSDTPDTVEGLRSKSLPPSNITPFAQDQIVAYLTELTTAPEDIASLSDMRKICQSLNDKRHFDQLSTLLSAHPKWVLADPDLSVYMANVYREKGARAAALDRLRNAFSLAPDRMPLFKRILRLTASLHSREKAKEFLAECSARLPGQADQFKCAFDTILPKAEQ